MLVIVFLVLTGEVRHLSQLFGPVLGDLDALLLHLLTLRRHPLLGRVLHQLAEVVGVQRVEDVEEVITRWALALREFVRDVRHEDLVALELRVDVLHRQFIIVRHLDRRHRLLLEQLLLAREHFLEEVLGEDALIWKIELEAVD